VDGVAVPEMKRNMIRTSQQELAAHNLRRVREYFATHICATQRECAAALRLSIMEINQHVYEIRREWKLKGEHYDVSGATGASPRT
jgi:hypothetical protein